jgi:tetratricopeptide (TPR) repeat protein
VELELPPPAAGVVPLVITDYAEAQRWYDTERANLVAIVRAAAELRMDRIAWQLPAVMREVYSYKNPFEDWFTTTRIGLDAARREGDRLGEAMLLESLGMASRQTRRYQDSLDFHSQALDIWRERGDRAGQALAILRIGIAHTEMRHLDTAREQYLLALEIYEEIGHERAVQPWRLSSHGYTASKATSNKASNMVIKERPARGRSVTDRTKPTPCTWLRALTAASISGRKQSFAPRRHCASIGKTPPSLTKAFTSLRTATRCRAAGDTVTP